MVSYSLYSFGGPELSPSIFILSFKIIMGESLNYEIQSCTA